MLCKTCKEQKFHSKTQNTFFTLLYNFKVNVSHRNCKQQIKYESSLFDMQYVYQAGGLVQKNCFCSFMCARKFKVFE